MNTELKCIQLIKKLTRLKVQTQLLIKTTKNQLGNLA